VSVATVFALVGALVSCGFALLWRCIARDEARRAEAFQGTIATLRAELDEERLRFSRWLQATNRDMPTAYLDRDGKRFIHAGPWRVQ
jgi:type VI protein secretion system component VasK